MHVYVDTHEKPYVHVAFKKKLRKAKYSKKSLPIGDIVAGRFIFERKTLNDLYKSIIKGNLFEQIRQLNIFREENEDAIIVILLEYAKLTKANERYNRLWNINEIMVNIMQQFNMFVVRTANIDSTVRFINDVANYENEDKEIIKEVRGFKRRKTLRDKKIFALTGLPSIGVTKAERILSNYKNLMDYFKSQEGNKNQVAEVLFR
jgi:DNA excision repair protein ERCC-4